MEKAQIIFTTSEPGSINKARQKEWVTIVDIRKLTAPPKVMNYFPKYTQHISCICMTPLQQSKFKLMYDFLHETIRSGQTNPSILNQLQIDEDSGPTVPQDGVVTTDTIKNAWVDLGKKTQLLGEDESETILTQLGEHTLGSIPD